MVHLSRAGTHVARRDLHGAWRGVVKRVQQGRGQVGEVTLKGRAQAGSIAGCRQHPWSLRGIVGTWPSGNKGM